MVPHGEFVDHLLKTRNVPDLRIAGVPYDRVPGAAQSFAHVAAHPAESDESQFHWQLLQAAFVGTGSVPD
jgi:hypothetical protein